MPNNESSATFRDIDWNAEVRKQWGAEWAKPEVTYEFSNGRKFVERTEDAAIYRGSPNFPA